MRIIKEYFQFLNNKRIDESISGKVRTRFAPSPTGKLHCGGIRTCLYNYLFAKQNNGDIILRIEDTDSTRFDPMAEKYIEDTFDWLGIEFDESPSKGGPYGPYRQSERKDIYKQYYKILIDSGKAYFAFDTPAELDQARQNNANFAYDYNTRMKMKNSLTLDANEVKNLIETTDDWAVRIKYPDEPVNITINDLIRGSVVINTSTLDDKVIWKKKDELPTYHLANIVDDHLMKITHVIRGEEWLPSAPLHVYLYECFGWDSPSFAHLPLILGPSGGKLSKRDGDKYGFPVFPIAYNSSENELVHGFREDGYLPEAVLNILAFIGWNPGTEKEIYTLDELIRDFDLSRINKAGAKFDPVKAAWFNGQHLKDKDSKQLLDQFKQDLKKRGVELSDDVILKILDDNRGKVNFIKDLYNEVEYLFKAPDKYEPKALRKWTPKSKEFVDGFLEKLKSLNDWESNNIKSFFETFVNNVESQFNEVVMPIRLLLTGKAFGPSIFDIMEMIGKDETIKRLSINLPFSYSDKKEVDSSKDSNLKEIELIQNLIKASEAKLSNKKFIDKAPPAVVQKEREKIEDLKIKLQDLKK